MAVQRNQHPPRVGEQACSRLAWARRLKVRDSDLPEQKSHLVRERDFVVARGKSRFPFPIDILRVPSPHTHLPFTVNTGI